MEFLREQNNGLICLDGTQKRLPCLTAWVKSSAVFWAFPSFPVAVMSFKTGKPDGSGYNEPVAMQYHATRKLWRVYLPASSFTEKCETYYKLTATDENGDRIVFGEGMLRVYAGKITDTGEQTETAEDCYALFSDGNWRRITVVSNSLGELTFSVAQTATTPIAGQTFSQPYAYNRTTGKFYSLNGVVDSTGEAYLAVAEAPSEEGEKSYAKNETSGLYYRIETSQDATGTMTANVGEQK